MDEIFETILRLYGKPGIDASYLPKLIRNKATGEVRIGYGEPDSSLKEVCWQFGSSRAENERDGPRKSVRQCELFTLEGTRA
jgi:hypothetical protein